MPNASSSGTDAPSATKLKVFLSYSRKDSTFAQELQTCLEVIGFDAYRDKADIAPAEPWEERISALIRSADTVVFVISPNSIASSYCTMETEEAERIGKRLVPVVFSNVPNNEIPDRLRRLNYVYFNEGNSFAGGLRDLTRALRTNEGWIRGHTRYNDDARRWIEHGRSPVWLLRITELDDAKRWLTQQPADGPEISVHQQEYIQASVKAAEKARRRTHAVLTFSTAGFAVLAVLAGLKWWEANDVKRSLEHSLTRTQAEKERFALVFDLLAHNGKSAFLLPDKSNVENRNLLATETIGAARHVAERDLTGTRILWIDDRPNTFEINEIQKRLRKIGPVIMRATDVNEALDRLKTDTFNVVISDYGYNECDRSGEMTSRAECVLEGIKQLPSQPPMLIYSSGVTPEYSDDWKCKGAVAETDDPFLLVAWLIRALDPHFKPSDEIRSFCSNRQPGN